MDVEIKAASGALPVDREEAADFSHFSPASNTRSNGPATFGQATRRFRIGRSSPSASTGTAHRSTG